MRLRRAEFQRRVNGSLHIEFGAEKLTSYAGLELLLRFVRQLGLRQRLRELGARLGFGGDTGFASTLILFVAMLLVGARRLRHVGFLDNDPLVLRFAGLGRLPSQSTLGRFLKRFNYERYTQLEELSREIVWDSVSQLRFPRLTVDVDGSVLSTGLKVGRAFRGFNPHRRKNPSYYPITAQAAEILKNQPPKTPKTPKRKQNYERTNRRNSSLKAPKLIKSPTLFPVALR